MVYSERSVDIAEFEMRGLKIVCVCMNFHFRRGGGGAKVERGVFQVLLLPLFIQILHTLLYADMFDFSDCQ